MSCTKSDHSRKQLIPREFRYILLILKCLGIDVLEKNGKRISCSNIFFHYLIPVIYHLFLAERMFLYITLIIAVPQALKAFSSIVINCVLDMVLWYNIFLRRKQLKNLLHRFFNISEISILKDINRSRANCMFMAFIHISSIVLVALPIAYGIGEYKVLIKIPVLVFYNVIMDKSSVFQRAVTLIRGILNSVKRDTFCGAVCLLYSLVCWQISRNLVSHRLLWGQILKQKDSTAAQQRNIFTRYASVLKLVEDINLFFSLPTFLLTVINGLSLFSLMAFVFNDDNISPYVILQVSVILGTSAVFLTVTVTMGSQITIEIEKNLNYLGRFQEEVLQAPLRLGQSPCQLKLLEVLKNRPVRLLNGCHFLYFRRGLLLTLVGTLFTYGLLIVNYK